MHTPSEDNKATEDQNDNAGDTAGSRSAGIGKELQPEDSLAELPVDATVAAAQDRENEAADERGLDDVEAPADDTESAPDPAEDEPEVATTSPGGLPRYKCHKVVTAFLIAAAEAMSNGRVRLSGVDSAHEIIVDADYVDKHRPQIGGYYVRYHDGYQSWSPAAAFEASYHLVD